MQPIFYDLGFWKVASDLMLTASILYLGFRFVRSPQSASNMRQLQELDGALRALIKEAELTGSSLNEQLIKRQQNLEKILYDIEAGEQRMLRSIEGAEETRRAMESTLNRARIQHESEVTPMRHGAPVQAQQPAAEPPAPEFVMQRAERVAAAPAPNRPATQERKIAESPARSASRNIYGEEIDGAARAPQAQIAAQPKQSISRSAPAKAPQQAASAAYTAAATQPEVPQRAALSQAVEIQVDAPHSSTMHSQQLEDLYLAAEDLLKTGKDLEFVAARTKLPIEEVRMLSQLIIREQLEEHGRAAEKVEDPRLGVLGGIKRQVQTL